MAMNDSLFTKVVKLGMPQPARVSNETAVGQMLVQFGTRTDSVTLVTELHAVTRSESASEKNFSCEGRNIYRKTFLESLKWLSAVEPFNS